MKHNVLIDMSKLPSLGYFMYFFVFHLYHVFNVFHVFIYFNTHTLTAKLYIYYVHDYVT